MRFKTCSCSTLTDLINLSFCRAALLEVGQADLEGWKAELAAEKAALQERQAELQASLECARGQGIKSEEEAQQLRVKASIGDGSGLFVLM